VIADAWLTRDLAWRRELVKAVLKQVTVNRPGAATTASTRPASASSTGSELSMA
jgi:hypothetical protein